MKNHAFKRLYPDAKLYMRCEKCELTAFASEEAFDKALKSAGGDLIKVNRFVHIITRKGVAKCNPHEYIHYSNIVGCKYTDEEWMTKSIIE